jgi:hypothetical protein
MRIVGAECAEHYTAWSQLHPKIDAASYLGSINEQKGAVEQGVRLLNGVFVTDFAAATTVGNAEPFGLKDSVTEQEVEQLRKSVTLMKCLLSKYPEGLPGSADGQRDNVRELIGYAENLLPSSGAGS